ncbi:hypothetical protein AB0E08_07880 [Streptomyces sp. NPDC048281]|uniref:hypothetical protein n=1 Tax=Streptomyces sp. NPDC048281 TaxID=3154715 RepID=UPI00343DEC2E
MQQFGLELLVLADGWATADQDEKTFKDQLKLALVATGVEASELWPREAADVPAAEDADADYDYSAVNWKHGSTDDWERMQQQLAASRMQVSGKREPEDQPPVPDMGDEFDREWQ